MTTALHPALPSSAIRGQGLPLVAGGGMAGLGAGNPQVVTKPLTPQDDFCRRSVTQLCLTLWDPMDCSTLGFPVLHYLPEFARTHVR